MCTAGRVKYHLRENLYNPNSSVIFVGYQAEGTLGRRIVEGADRVRLYGEDVAVRARIHTLGGFSAHADQKGLLDWMGKINNPNLQVFVVHGEEQTSLDFAQTVQEHYGLKTYVPHWGEIVNLDSMESELASYGITGDIYSHRP